MVHMRQKKRSRNRGIDDESCLGRNRMKPIRAIRIMIDLLQKANLRFDILSHMLDNYLDLIKGVGNVTITRNRNVTYENTFESVVGELIERASRESFHSQSIRRAADYPNTRHT